MNPDTMIEASGAQIIVKLLERQRVDTVAGIPGGAILPLYDELAKSSIRHILVRHEQAAGFFAQGIARSTGKTAVCIATSGPGALNLLTAIADARSDSIPLVAITGQVNTSLIGTDAFQEADTFGLSLPITKHSVLVKKTEDLLTVIPEAFRIASSGRPGPVLIDIPRDVQSKKIRFAAWPEPAAKTEGAERFGTCNEQLSQALAEAADMLIRSKRPVLYVGGGAASAEAARELASFCSVYPLPAVSSLMGIGVVPKSAPFNMGMVGMHGSIAANRAMYESDAVIAVGVRFDDRAAGLAERFCPNARIIHIDVDAAEINKILESSVSIVGNSADILAVLTPAVKEKLSAAEVAAQAAPNGADLRVCTAEKERKAWYEKNNERAQKEQGQHAKPLPYQREGRPYPDPRLLIKALPLLAEEAGLKARDLIITTDVGQHQMWAAQYYPVERPRSFLTSGSLGTMGFGLPAAIGAAYANPTKRVVCISGDGSILMNIQELATLAELNCDVSIIVLDNGTLGMVHQQQELLYNKNYSACIFDRQADLSSIARGFGIESVDTEKDPSWHLKAFPPAGSGPRFIRCLIDKGENVYPFVPAGKANIDAMTGD